MKTLKRSFRGTVSPSFLKIIFFIFIPSLATGQEFSAKHPAWSTHAHDVQHTGVSSVAAQPLLRIHWSTPVDLNAQLIFGELLVHYGSPLITAKNTVIVPVKTGASDGFRVEAREGRSGSLLWIQNTDYSVPSAPFTPSFGPANAIGIILYFILRDPLPRPCPSCGAAVAARFPYCPSCGTTVAQTCPNCRRPVEPAWSHCAHCGASLRSPRIPVGQTEGREL